MSLFINTAELKRDTNQVLRKIVNGPAIITRHGHPCAALVSISGQEVEELLWEFSPKVQKKIRKGLKEAKEGKGITLSKFAKKYGLL